MSRASSILREPRNPWIVLWIAVFWLLGNGASASENISLPRSDGSVSIATQPWPRQPGPRHINVHIRYPGGNLPNVDENTGLMLSLHNWGGTAFTGTADPVALAERYNVIAIGVDYLQSGQRHQDHPYDFGYLQAIDALRALHFVYDRLEKLQRPFARGRIFATGGSGGGNVTLMVNKFAPRTFACCIDICGMAELSDDIAFNLPGGSRLDARYSQDPQSANFLSPDAQQIRFVGNPRQVATMKRLGNTCKLIVVHGSGDDVCPVADARRMVDNIRAGGVDVEAHFITREDLDGRVFTSIGHALGNRTEIVFRLADKYLLPGSPETRVRSGPCDFQRRDEQVRYKTENGQYIVSYKSGVPEIAFEPK